MSRVENKVALVTGAASNPGLGREAALTLAREGAKLVVTDVDLEGAESTAEAIRAAGGDAIALEQNVTDEAQWNAIVEQTVAHFGKLDILVNNAGIAVLVRLEDMTMEQWNRQIDVNLTSIFLGCRAVISAMRHNGGGSIVNLSSTAGLVGMSTCVAYGAAKGGVRIMSKSVAVELAADNIRCNSVHPGFIWTNMQSAASGQTDPAELQLSPDLVPLGRVGYPADVANCILYLSSDESNYVTGAEFTVDAGMTAH